MVLPAAASVAVRPLLTGGRHTGHVVAVFPSCAYLDLDGRLVALETQDAHRLPCAVAVAAPAAARPFRGVAPGDEVSSADRTLRVGDLTVQVARWWAPARVRGATTAATAMAADGRWDTLALGLLGLGPGLTPAGDDVLAGLLVGLAPFPLLRDPLATAVRRHAAARTTWLSAELLRHAADGRAASAVVAVADALAGHGDAGALRRALPALLALGHTSGAALARGLQLAATTVLPRTAHHREAA